MAAAASPIAARRALERLERAAWQADFRGPDPYDGLASPIARILPGAFARRVLVQCVRRSPVNLRPILRIPKLRMANSLALFASGYARATWLGDAAAKRTALVADLLQSRRAMGWGYEFDVHTRWGSYRRDEPNIVCTSFASDALWDEDETQADRDARSSWLTSDMTHPRGHFRYAPGNDALIHNANLLGAKALNRVHRGHPATRRAVEVTLTQQRADGLWAYGEGPALTWVDSFHTAYVLTSLADIGGFDESLERGVTAWLAHCFDETRHPRYFADRSGPDDLNNIATALYSLARLERSFPECGQFIAPTLSYALRFQDEDGWFRLPGKPAYVRWNAGPMFLALAELTSR